VAITVAVLTAQLKLDAQDFIESMDDAKKSYTKFGNELRGAGLGLTEFVTGPILAMAGAIFKAGVDIDSAFDEIRIKTGATGKEMEGLKDDFRGVFGEVTQGAAEVGDVLGVLHTRTGATGAVLQDLGIKTLDLARIIGGDAREAADQTTRAFQKWGVATDEMGGKLDFLLKVQQKTGLDAQKNARFLTDYGATLHALGYNFDQAATMMGKWEQEGVKTQFVANALRTGLRNMLKEGIEDPVKAFPLLIQRIKDTGTEGEAAARAIAVFGARGGTDLVDAIRKGYLTVDDFTKKLQKNKETITGLAKEVDDFPQQLQKLRNEFILAIEPIGTQFFNAVAKVIDELRGPLITTVKQVADWWVSLKPSTQIAIAAFVAIVASIGPVLFILGQLVIAIGAILPVAATVITFLAGPWGIVIAGVAVALYKLTVGNARNLTEFMNNIKEFFAWMAPFWQKEWNGISSVFKAVWKALDDIIGGAVQTITYIVTGFIDLFTGNWTGFLDNMKLAWGTFWEKLLDFVTNFWPRLRDAANEIINGLIDLFTGGSKKMKDSMDKQITEDSKAGSASAADKIKKDPALQKKWSDVGKSHVTAIAAGVKEQAHQSTSQIQDHITNMFAGAHKKPKAHKLTEAEKEAKQLTSALQAAHAQLDALDEAADMSTSKLFAKFHAIASSHKKDIINLADMRAEINLAQTAQNEMRKWQSMMDSAKEKVVELKNEGLPTAEALANIFPLMANSEKGMQRLESLAKELDLKKELIKGAEEHRKAVEQEVHWQNEYSTKLAGAQEEILRLTHTRVLDIASLDLYHKTFDSLSEADHRENALQLAYWLGEVERTKEEIKQTKELADEKKELGKAVGEMKQKLLLRGEAEEAANAAKVMLTPFEKLPLIIQQLEEENEAQRRWNKTFAELDPELKAQIEDYLGLAHAVNIKVKADKDDEEQQKKSENLTKRMTDRLAELQVKIDHFKDPRGENKQSKFVTDILAEQLKLTEEQKKMLDEIIKKEKELGPLEKHAKVMQKLADEMQTQFTQLFEHIAGGSKGAFKEMEDGFVKMLQKMAAEYLASQLTQLLFGIAGNDGQRSGGLFGKVFGGGKASGGMVQGGKTYLVGEHGPELVKMPASGQVVPNHQIGNSAPIINITVYAQDANSFNHSRNQIAQSMLQAMQQAQIRNGG
jgi:TP901 family phage tail tape measure protein